MQNSSVTTSRLHNLDYLRGIAAFGIMIYHYMAWSYGEADSNTFLRRFGYYGVSIFYVLSGLTLYYVYRDKLAFNIESMVGFYKKRIFRIFPLMWLVIFAAILLSRSIPSFIDLTLNLTGLFGFFKWYKYLSTGLWSIGNELVFYIFFPFFLLFSRNSKPALILTTFALLALYIYFAFFRIEAGGKDLAWRNYVNPLNQVFLFLGGFIIGYVFTEQRMPNLVSVLFIIMGLTVFIFYPTHGDSITLIAGYNRLVFTFACFCICLGFYKTTILLPQLLHRPLILLGEASYSLYLIHPIVWRTLSYILDFLGNRGYKITDTSKIMISIIITLIGAYIVYQYFEKFFMKLGRKVPVVKPILSD